MPSCSARRSGSFSSLSADEKTAAALEATAELNYATVSGLRRRERQAAKIVYEAKESEASVRPEVARGTTCPKPARERTAVKRPTKQDKDAIALLRDQLRKMRRRRAVQVPGVAEKIADWKTRERDGFAGQLAKARRKSMQFENYADSTRRVADPPSPGYGGQAGRGDRGAVRNERFSRRPRGTGALGRTPRAASGATSLLESNPGTDGAAHRPYSATRT